MAMLVITRGNIILHQEHHISVEASWRPEQHRLCLGLGERDSALAKKEIISLAMKNYDPNQDILCFFTLGYIYIAIATMGDVNDDVYHYKTYIYRPMKKYGVESSTRNGDFTGFNRIFCNGTLVKIKSIESWNHQEGIFWWWFKGNGKRHHHHHQQQQKQTIPKRTTAHVSMSSRSSGTNRLCK